MKITSQNVIGTIVANNYKAAEIFKKYNIDFCCRGQLTMEEACIKGDFKLSEAEELLQEVNDLFEKPLHKEEIDFKELPLDTFVEHIETKHHAYVEEKIPVLKEYLNKIEAVHGKQNPELMEINDIFKDASGQLVMHMKKEELILFPYIKKLARANREKTELQAPPFGTIKEPIRKMDEEHDFEGEAFRKIAALSNHYNAPEKSCNTYKVTFELLKEFEEDLHLHIHKENNILFKRAIALEELLLA